MKAPFRIATLEALKNPSRVKVCCVLAKGDRIISVGKNDMDKTHPLAKGHRKTHAEIAACKGLRPYDIKGCSAYVCRVTADGDLALAKPCICCQSVLNNMGIKKIFYTNNNKWNVL